ncbi:uncharacterized protein DNG_01428 [Cephalotrichum gorgonifer]|uniref:Uncharacterized protein n=1 Tax=Cephalotrichum gorgonifer TaxID=2041049 RepID=A0AAE8MRV5_9PEZI|nr:uncharacterized protein DNG_01428 [Cephalotrichum gorgonifer]
MHLLKWIERLKFRGPDPGRSEKQPEEEEYMKTAPPAYPPSQLAENTRAAVVGYIESFGSSRCSVTPDWQLKMMILPSTDYLAETAYENGLDWVAILIVRATDLPALMKRGFHVSKDNVQKGKGFFKLGSDVPTRAQSLGLLHTRRYVLAAGALQPGWSAAMTVYARSIRDLSEFRAENPTAGNVAAAVGYNERNEIVYNYSSTNPEANFNAVYDDMPMEGWWPWPRAPKKISAYGELLRRAGK